MYNIRTKTEIQINHNKMSAFQSGTLTFRKFSRNKKNCIKKNGICFLFLILLFYASVICNFFPKCIIEAS